MTFDFATFAPAEPDTDHLRSAFSELLQRLPDDPAGVLADEDALVRSVESWTGTARIRYRQDTTDAEYQSARSRSDALGVLLKELQQPFKEQLLADPALAAAVGPQERALWSSEVASFSPEVSEEILAEQGLSAEYMGLYGGAKVVFRGEEMTLSQLQKPETSGDRVTREEACRVRWTWFATHRAELDRIFDELVALRGTIAGKLGHRDFVETGYHRMSRVDWARDDAARFRERMLANVVPLVTAMRADQAKRLGLDSLMLWDEPVWQPEGAPTPTDDLEAAGQLAMSGLGEDLGAFYGLLRSAGLMDLHTRPGKGPGGFCSFLAEPRLPFIFANFAGTHAGVKTLVHELGHAYQCYSSRVHARLADVWPTSEAAEVHSMSLEFLAWPQMESFFGDDAGRWRRNHLMRALAFLPYGSAVDAFQHRVYEEPGLGAAGRHGAWRELESSWMPWRGVEGIPHVADGGLWQRQLHIYNWPFYYLDYVLAQVCALQLWRLSQDDHADAMDRWTRLCRLGGTLPFQDMVRSVGLRSPFDEGVLEDVVDSAATWLDL